MAENLPEQIPLEFTAPKSDTLKDTQSDGVHFEGLTTKELERRYHTNVGKDPRTRFLDIPEKERRGILIEGMRDKETALARLAVIDRQADQEARENHWSN